MSLIDWKYGLDTLKKKVVRVIFIKKGNGAVREMWATRNPDLIASYLGLDDAEDRLGDNDREKLLKQKNNNNLVVFDLEKNAFRTVPLDNIEAVDRFNGVPGWIEFGIYDEFWKDIMNGNMTISDYYNF